MITVSDEFKKAIRANVVSIQVEAVFNYGTPVSLTNKDIVGMNVTQRGEIALGGVQEDAIIIEVSAASLIDHYLEDTTVEVKIGCLVNGTPEYASVGVFKTSRWKKSSYTIQVELGTNIDLEKEILGVLARQNVSLKDYITQGVTEILGITLVLGEIVDTSIPVAYLYYKTVREQLKAFGMSSNGLFRYSNKGLEIVPYKLSPPVDTLTEGVTGLILEALENENDYVSTKKNVAVKTSTFLRQEDSVLYSFSGSVKDPLDYQFSFSSASIITYIQHKGCDFTLREYGLFGGRITLESEIIGVTSQAQLSIVGTRIGTHTLDSVSGDITTPYIQTAEHVELLSKDVLNGEKFSFKSRIDPSLQVGDTVTTPKGDMMITSMSYKFDGGLTGTIEGVIA